MGKAAWYATFHSVSAFNNGGFDLFGGFRSLTGFAGDPVVNLTIASLFIIGSLGFLVIYELIVWKEQRTLSLHTRVVLIGSLALLVTGAIMIFSIEYGNTLNKMSIAEKGIASLFMSATRTAGFSVVDMSQMIVPTQILLIFLMFIGGAPGSTAGGIKVTTLAVVFAALFSLFKGKNDVEIWGRRLSDNSTQRALAIMFLSLFLILIDIFILSFYHDNFMQVLFEVVSATSTVGLSLGLTQELGIVGKLVIIITMFVGRLGPITIGYALAYGPKHPNIRYPKGEIMLG